MTCNLDDVLITGELSRRSRQPDYQTEARALRGLMQGLAEDPDSLPQKIVETVLTVCRAHSAGLSILEPSAPPVFRWKAVAGPFAGNIGGTMPASCSPCGDVLTRGTLLLFDRPDRYFAALRDVRPQIYEAMLAPWEVDEHAGTVWALAHSPDRHFDAEDARLLASISRFAAAAKQQGALSGDGARRPWPARDRARTETALRLSEQRLRLIVDSVKDYAIITLDRGGLITSWNPGAERIFGWSADEALRRHAGLIFIQEDREASVPQEEMLRAAETGHAEEERWQLHKSGRRLFVSGVLAPLRDNGRIDGYVKVARDTTARKRVEVELQQAHSELEARVQERTADLADAAAALQRELRDRAAAENRIKALFDQLVTIQEDERGRIAREIHDQLGQQMTALRMSLDTLLSCTDPGSAAGEQALRAARLAQELDESIDFLTWDLRPAALDHLGLSPALDNLVRGWSDRFGIPAEYHAVGVDSVRLPPHAESNLYRIVQEALHNVYRHAGASNVGVVLERSDGELVLTIEDDGRGFDPDAATNMRRGLGLVNIQERANLIGGQAEVESTTGSGTTIYVRVPLTTRV